MAREYRKTPVPERFAMPFFVEKPITERELLNAYTKLVLAECDGNKSAAARALGISRYSVMRRIKRMPKGDN